MNRVASVPCAILDSQNNYNLQWRFFRYVFSRCTGRSHSAEYRLWSLGVVAKAAVGEFAERGVSAQLDNEAQGDGGILDTFCAASMPRGVGRVAVELTVDPRHTKVTPRLAIPACRSFNSTKIVK